MKKWEDIREIEEILAALNTDCFRAEDSGLRARIGKRGRYGRFCGFHCYQVRNRYKNCRINQKVSVDWLRWSKGNWQGWQWNRYKRGSVYAHVCGKQLKTAAWAKFMGRGTPKERHIDWRQLIHYIGPTKSLPISLLSRRYPYYSAESPSLLLTPDSENLSRLYHLANRLKMYSPDYSHQKQALPWIQDRYEGL